MKRLKRLLVFLHLWLLRKLGYSLPSLREARSVAPGVFYDLFGRIVRAVPSDSSSPTFEEWEPHEEIPDHCLCCDLYKQHIPCTFNHRMANGNDICANHHFEIIGLNRGNI